jgi:hypothetical protein
MVERGELARHNPAFFTNKNNSEDGLNAEFSKLR